MPGGTEAIQLSAAILRNQAPDLVLRLGSTVAARVLERHGARGLISIGNAVLAAELPGQVRAGEKLTLLVHDASEERVVLKLVEQGQPPQAPAIALPLPNGARAHLRADAEEHGAQRTAHCVAVAYNSPSLGALRFQLSLDSRSLAVNVRAAPGVALEAAEAGANELRDALANATGRAVQVTVLPREEPVDLYA